MHLRSLIEGPIVKKGVEEIMRIMISTTLFPDCAIAGHALLEDFRFPMASLQVCLQS
jgi:hypothetical protein